MRKSCDHHARIPASIIGADITLRQLRVYSALSWYKGGNATCWPKLATLARLTKMDERNVRRTLAELEDLKLVKREYRSDENRPTLYTIFEPEMDLEMDDCQDSPLGAELALPPGGQISPPHIEQSSMNNTETQISTDVDTAQAPGDPGINELISFVKGECEKRGWAYDKEDDRRMARHILTAKDFKAQAEKCGMTPMQYALTIFNIAAAVDKTGAAFLPFWRGKITGPAAIYRKHAKVFNDAKEAKARNAPTHSFEVL